MPEPLLITPTELRQHHYCPRVVFFERCTPVRRRETVLMTHGREKHQTELLRERRRTLSRYDLAEGERRYDLRLTSPALGLTGELDLLIVDGTLAFPVEFKHTSRPPDPGHKLQLCAYALLVEAELHLSCPHGYWHSSRTRQTHTIPFDTRLRNRTRAAIETLRGFILAERCPPPTPQATKCLECELRNFCGDTL
ncbi:CRISPR-associated exonuclease, Cas4 family [Deinococcus aerius]|uniref:CRISPR-associated exonuclease Cas4 n=1 Tax=Deinococcus aerius TaxID=200253 RepID=A0A2I9CVP9_9DEIO|nr:CRISPR-associated protein Cas4 [Deinococcus aerius]GBF06012.1 CRISPR-associated exonuclease, Cas4 family [Deinococcus aerius]